MTETTQPEVNPVPVEAFTRPSDAPGETYALSGDTPGDQEVISGDEAGEAPPAFPDQPRDVRGGEPLDEAEAATG